MNKISDLKVGGKVYDKNHGEHIVYEKGYFYSNFKKIGLIFTKNGEDICEHEIDWQKTTELNNKQMKEFIIECPSGFEVDKEKSTFEKIVFKEIENKLPVSVEEIPNRNFYIDAGGGVREINDCSHINQLSTKERAEAILALMQLVELRDAYNGDWKADYNNESQRKFCIMIKKGLTLRAGYPLYFKSGELRDQFAEQFKDLIEAAKELL